MLRSLKDILKYKIHAEKNDIGSIDFFIFYPIEWSVEFILVEVKIPPLNKRVLVPTSEIYDADGELRVIFLKTSIKDVLNCCEYKKDKKVIYKDDEKNKTIQLRSTFEFIDYDVYSKKEKVGHILDLICDDNKWLIRYLVVDTGNWLPGKKVLVSPHWIEFIDWEKQEVYTELTRDQIKDSPEYDPTEPVNIEYEAVLYDYYGKPRYWNF